MDRLVELFESTLSQGDEDGVQSFVHFESVLEGQGVDMGGAFCMLAMGLEKKPHLKSKAELAYKRVLLLLNDRLQNERQRSVKTQLGWERCVVLQQLGKLLHTAHPREAETFLLEILGKGGIVETLFHTGFL